MNDLGKLLMESISNGLSRKSVTSCSRWSCRYRVMGPPFPGAWTFLRHPWLREMCDCDAEFIIGQKAAQMGYSEFALNKTFYKIDVEGVDVLYCLPSSSDASDFSSGRFDSALQESPYLSTLFTDANNVGHKRSGSHNLYVRGSRSRSKLKSVPVSCVIFDELAEMAQENIPLALERTSGQVNRQIIMISTPTVDGHGINAYFNQSTQEHFFFPCPHCNHWVELTFPDCLVITAESILDPKINESYICCPDCKVKIDHELKYEYFKTAKFIPSFPDREMRGFHVNQFYSSAQAGRPSELAKAAIRSRTDATEATEFYNSKLGAVFQAEGAKVTDAEIDQCIQGYRKGPTNSNNIVTMGVDVGKQLHIEIDSWMLPANRTPGLDINDEATPRLLFEGTCRDFSDLDKLMYEYGINFAVIDRYPESRMSYQFATRFYGRVLMCMYGRGLAGKNVQLGSEVEHTVTVDRTAWLDLSLSRFRNKRIILPGNLSPEYRKHVKEPVRVYEKDSDGNPVGRYVNVNADHFGHSRTYSEIALPFATGRGDYQNVSGII